MSKSFLAFAAAAALLLPTADLAAQNPAVGEWEWTAQGRGGEVTRTLAFTIRDDMLTGTILAAPDAEAVALTEVSFVDGTLKFAWTRAGRRGEITQTFTATISGDTMTGTIEGGRGRRGGGGRGGTPEFTATRKTA